MSLLDEIRRETAFETRKTASRDRFNLDAIITKVAEEDEDEGGEKPSGDANGAPGGEKGNDENGEIPGLGEGGQEEEANEGVQLPPELQHLLMMLMQHPELLQQLMHGGGMPDAAMAGMPGGDMAGQGAPGEEGAMPPAMAAAAGGGGAPAM